MKSLSLSEVAQIALSLQSMVGAHLQDALQTSSEVGLGFYKDRETTWLWLDLHPQRPVLVRVPGRAPKRKKITRPLTLFLKSNFSGRRLRAVRADLDRGRVLVLEFARAESEQVENPGPCEIEIRLFPRGQNILARNGRKSVAEIKPKELAVAGKTSFGQAHAVSDSTQALGGGNFVVTSRTWEEITSEWWGEQGEVTASTKTGPIAANVQDSKALDHDYRKALEKKKKALLRMEEDLGEKRRDAEIFRRVGEWLKSTGTLELTPETPTEISAAAALCLKGDRSLSWNIENCFAKAKEGARKIGGSEQRIGLVEREIRALEARGPESFARKREQDEKKGASNLLSKSAARGRRFELGEGLEVYIGKSAADNLALLRRAQPFDYWLHLRDHPGSHAILRRTRQRVVSDAEFQTAGCWVIEQSLGSRASESRGERFDLLIVECRFVKPIKGDRLGRVNYSNDRVLSIRY